MGINAIKDLVDASSNSELVVTVVRLVVGVGRLVVCVLLGLDERRSSSQVLGGKVSRTDGWDTWMLDGAGVC